MARLPSQPINPNLQSITHNSLYPHSHIQKSTLTPPSNHQIFNIHNLTKTKPHALSQLNHHLLDPYHQHNKKHPHDPFSAKSLNTSSDYNHLQPRDIAIQAKNRNTNPKIQTQEYQKQSLDQTQTKFQTQKTTNHNPKHKGQRSNKTISRYLFQINIPQLTQQSLTSKVNKFKLIQTNQQTNHIQSLNHQKKQTIFLKPNKPKQSIPQFIKPSLQIYSQPDENIDKNINHFKFDIFQNNQPTTTKQSSLSKRLRYAMKLKKIHKQKQDNECSIITQPILKPKIDVLKLSEKVKGGKQSKMKYQKYRQTPTYLIKHRKQQLINADQDVNVCGWQYRENNFNDILQ